MSTVLDAERHARLIDDLDHVCAVARVPKQYIEQSMKSVCGAAEIDWVTNFRMYRESCAGLVLEGQPNSEGRCLAIGGALIRNFIDARVLGLNQVVDMLDAQQYPEATVLIIPNLFVSQVGKSLPAWKVNRVYDLLLTRFTENRPTVVAIESLNDLGNAYGSSFEQLLTHHYRIAESKKQ